MHCAVGNAAASLSLLVLSLTLVQFTSCAEFPKFHSDWFKLLLQRNSDRNRVFKKRSIEQPLFKDEGPHKITTVLDEPKTIELRLPSLKSRALQAVIPEPSQIGAISKFYDKDYDDEIEQNPVQVRKKDAQAQAQRSENFQQKMDKEQSFLNLLERRRKAAKDALSDYGEGADEIISERGEDYFANGGSTNSEDYSDSSGGSNSEDYFANSGIGNSEDYFANGGNTNSEDYFSNGGSPNSDKDYLADPVNASGRLSSGAVAFLCLIILHV